MTFPRSSEFYDISRFSRSFQVKWPPCYYSLVHWNLMEKSGINWKRTMLNKRILTEDNFFKLYFCFFFFTRINTEKDSSRENGVSFFPGTFFQVIFLSRASFSTATPMKIFLSKTARKFSEILRYSSQNCSAFC